MKTLLALSLTLTMGLTACSKGEQAAPGPVAQASMAQGSESEENKALGACAAAALNSNNPDAWKKTAKLRENYKRERPSDSQASIESLAMKSLFDAKRRLKEEGIEGPDAYAAYFKKNCAETK